MASLYMESHAKPVSLYRDRRYSGDMDEREKLLKRSTTLYVGNLSFYTTEEQVFELFSKAGEIRRIVMGLDKFKKTPCGFCFVEYFTRRDAEASVLFLSGLKLDERVIRVDYDVGFSPGRQFGRGRSGGQVRDEYRTDYDPGRGGYGHSSGMSGMEMWGNSSSTRAPQGNGPDPSNGVSPGSYRHNRGRGRFDESFRGGAPRTARYGGGGPGSAGGGGRGGGGGGGPGRPGPRGFDQVGQSFPPHQQHGRHNGPPRGAFRRASFPGSRYDDRSAPRFAGSKRRRDSEDDGPGRGDPRYRGDRMHQAPPSHEPRGHDEVMAVENDNDRCKNDHDVDFSRDHDFAPKRESVEDGREAGHAGPGKRLRMSVDDANDVKNADQDNDVVHNARFDRGKNDEHDTY